jgi:hypothetical protein
MAPQYRNEMPEESIRGKTLILQVTVESVEKFHLIAYLHKKCFDCAPPLHLSIVSSSFFDVLVALFQACLL